jgi:hypothetical protein
MSRKIRGKVCRKSCGKFALKLPRRKKTIADFNASRQSRGKLSRQPAYYLVVFTCMMHNYLYMNIYMHIHWYIYLYDVFSSIYTYITCIFTCKSIHTWIFIQIYMHTCTFRGYMYCYMHKHLDIHAYSSVFFTCVMYIHLYMHTHPYSCAYAHIWCVFICINTHCMHIHLYLHT